MRPKSRKSREPDVASSKRLSTNMKQPQSKSRSSESLGKPIDSSGKISPLAKHLLNATRSIRPKRALGSEDSRGDTSQARVTRARPGARASLFAGSSQASLVDELGDILSNEVSVQSNGSSSSLAHDSSSTSQIQRMRRLPSQMRTPMTPRIMVSKCEKLEKLVEEQELGKTAKKVLRGKIKSPVNKIQKSIIERNLKSKDRIESYESQIRKKESELLSLTRKINSLQKTVNEKDKTIKGLEKKFPKMIFDLKQGLFEEKKANVEMKEMVKKFRQVNGDKSKMEEQLKVKDDKIMDIKHSKKRLVEELKSKDMELCDFRKRLQALEEKVPKLLEEIECKVLELQSKDEDLVRFDETVEFLEQRLSAQAEDQRGQEKLIDDLKRRLNMFCEELDAKEGELLDLKASHIELQQELQNQYDALERTDQETKNYLQIIDSIREKIDTAPANAVEKLHNSIDFLDKATEDFLDRVSSVSKKKNINFNVKLTIKKNRSNNVGQGNDTLDSIILNPNTLNNNVSQRLSFNNIQHSSRNSGRMSQGQETPFRPSFKTSFSRSHASFEESSSRRQPMISSYTNDFNDEVFEDGDEASFCKRSQSSKGSITESSVNTDASDYDVSSDTCNRLEELDNKVRHLWNRLSTASDVYQSGAKECYTSSVSKMENDLTHSVEQQKKFLNQVRVAKKLFNSPTPCKSSPS